MNLIEAVKDMRTLKKPCVNSICSALEDGYHVITGDLNNYGYNMLKYDIFINDGVLYFAKLSDSTADNIVVTIEMAALYAREVMTLLWTSYLSGKDFFFVDVVGYLHDALIDSGQFTVATFKKQLKRGEIVYLHDTYSTLQVVDHPTTKIYVVDNEEALICGLDVVKHSAQTVVNASITSEKKDADFIILIMKNTTKAPTSKIYEWLDDSNKEIPLVADTLRINELAYSEPHKILLYWSSNVIMAGLFDLNSATYKAAMELNDAVTAYHKR